MLIFKNAFRHAFSAFARGLSIGELVKAWTIADGAKQGLGHHRTNSQKSSTQLQWPTSAQILYPQTFVKYIMVKNQCTIELWYSEETNFYQPSKPEWIPKRPSRRCRPQRKSLLSMINSCLCPFRPNQPPAPKRPTCSNRPITLKKKSCHRCCHRQVRKRAREGEGARERASQTDGERETRKHYKCESDSAFEKVRIYRLYYSFAFFLSLNCNLVAIITHHLSTSPPICPLTLICIHSDFAAPQSIVVIMCYFSRWKVYIKVCMCVSE